MVLPISGSVQAKSIPPQLNKRKMIYCFSQSVNRLVGRLVGLPLIQRPYSLSGNSFQFFCGALTGTPVHNRREGGRFDSYKLPYKILNT